MYCSCFCFWPWDSSACHFFPWSWQFLHKFLLTSPQRKSKGICTCRTVLFCSFLSLDPFSVNSGQSDALNFDSPLLWHFCGNCTESSMEHTQGPPCLISFPMNLLLCRMLSGSRHFLFSPHHLGLVNLFCYSFIPQLEVNNRILTVAPVTVHT